MTRGRELSSLWVLEGKLLHVSTYPPANVNDPNLDNMKATDVPDVAGEYCHSVNTI